MPKKEGEGDLELVRVCLYKAYYNYINILRMAQGLQRL